MAKRGRAAAPRLVVAIEVSTASEPGRAVDYELEPGLERTDAMAMALHRAFEDAVPRLRRLGLEEVRIRLGPVLAKP